VFPGQGSQWFGMAQQLLEQEAVFREVIERCDRAMRPYGDWSLLAELTANHAAQSRLNEVDVIQPSLAIQSVGSPVALLGIEPHAVNQFGRGRGSVRRRCAEPDDAVRVICHRSRLFKRTIGQGRMAAVELSIDEARRVLVGYEDRVSIAVSNGPTSTVLSGDPAALAAILDQLQRRDIFCRMVKVDFASHSPEMERYAPIC
jgi:acyl transferase domain-containing protein